MWSEDKSIQSPRPVQLHFKFFFFFFCKIFFFFVVNLLAELIEDTHVGVCVVDVIGIWRILFVDPFLRSGHFSIEDRVFRFALVVDRVETNQLITDTSWNPLNFFFLIFFEFSKFFLNFQIIMITCCKNQCSSGCSSGLLVALKSGKNKLSISCWKLLINLLER